jgi:uncharacterized membrane protein YdbT with pleckstrin-like domain
MKYRQTKIAYIVSYVLYRWILAFCTLGYIAVIDYLRYKRHTLTLNEKSLEVNLGLFTQNKREVFYRNIQGVNVDQSILGQVFNYGNLVVTTANQSDSIVFEKVDRPEMLRNAIRDRM